MGRRIFAEKTFLGEEQDQIGPKKRRKSSLAAVVSK